MTRPETPPHPANPGRRAVAALASASAAIVTATLLGAAPASAANPVGRATTANLSMADPVDLAVVGDKAFVSTGSGVVRVFSTAGVPLHTVPDQAGVGALLPSADGVLVYAVLTAASAISAIDVATGTEVGRWAVDGCPRGLAMTGGRLFYSWGCVSFEGGISSLDPTAPFESPSIAASGDPGPWGSPPTLAGAGGRLVAAEPGSTPAVLVAYDVDGATLTRTGETIIYHPVEDFAVRPDGAAFATGNMSPPYGIREYALPTMAVSATYATGEYVNAVTYSADGGRIAGGMDYGVEDVVVVDRSTGEKASASTVHPAGEYNAPTVRQVAFSADGARLHALARSSDNHTYLATASAGTIAATRCTLKITSATVAGKSVVATATFTGGAGRAVTFTFTDRYGTQVTKTTSTNGSGVASSWAIMKFSGAVTVSGAGGRSSGPAGATAAYTAPSALKITRLGGYKTVNGVRYYRKVSGMRWRLTGAPAREMRVTARLQFHRSGRWVTVENDPATLPAGDSVVWQMYSAPRGGKVRVVVSFAGDSYNAKSSVVSGVAVLG